MFSVQIPTCEENISLSLRYTNSKVVTTIVKVLAYFTDNICLLRNLLIYPVIMGRYYLIQQLRCRLLLYARGEHSLPCEIVSSIYPVPKKHTSRAAIARTKAWKMEDKLLRKHPPGWYWKQVTAKKRVMCSICFAKCSWIPTEVQHNSAHLYVQFLILINRFLTEIFSENRALCKQRF